MKLFALLVLALLGCRPGAAQVDGLWAVTKVEVGSQQVTPVAKWFRFSKGEFRSGNGWQQHTFGSYHWNKAASELSLESTNEPSDGFGAFRVEKNGATMIWMRDEDGEKVRVLLQPIKDLPKAPADEAKGLWDLKSAKRNGADITKEIDPEGRQWLFLRWDKIFVKLLSPSERVQGYWHMNAHRPELTLVIERNPEASETWSVAFANGDLVLAGLSENIKGTMLIFSRMSAFQN